MIDALRQIPHPSHFNLEQAVAHIERFAPAKAILTNLHIDLDYEETLKATPDNVEPAYDMMSFSVDQN